MGALAVSFLFCASHVGAFRIPLCTFLDRILVLPYRILVHFRSHFNTFADRILNLLDADHNFWGSRIAFYYHAPLETT